MSRPVLVADCSNGKTFGAGVRPIYSSVETVTVFNGSDNRPRLETGTFVRRSNRAADRVGPVNDGWHQRCTKGSLTCASGWRLSFICSVLGGVSQPYRCIGSRPGDAGPT